MTRQKSRKLKRYHAQIYFPSWAGKSLQLFSENIRSRRSITFSVHALEKCFEYGFEYGRKMIKFISKTVREDIMKNGSVFEFYAVEEKILKVCLRISSSDSPVDLALVISSDGVIVTVFVINKGDNHDTLDENLYERNK